MLKISSPVWAALLVLGVTFSDAREVNAWDINLNVDAQSNLFGAGRDAAPDPGGNGGGILPPSYEFAAGSDLELVFSSVTGSVSYNNEPGDPNRGQWNGPDGGRVVYPPDNTEGFNTDINSYDGISGLSLVELIPEDRRVMFLAGVFLDASEPSGVAPARLAFGSDDLGTDFASLAPLLNQTFFIGDGLTGTGTGNQQRFFVPTGATRLFLGFIDGADFEGDPTFYSNNDGSFDASFSINSVPEPSHFVLILFTIALGTILLRRRPSHHGFQAII